MGNQEALRCIYTAYFKSRNNYDDQLARDMDQIKDSVSIGHNLDGDFGRKQCLHDLEIIPDLQKAPDLLKKRGDTDTDVRNLMHSNWLRFLKKASA